MIIIICYTYIYIYYTYSHTYIYIYTHMLTYTIYTIYRYIWACIDKGKTHTPFSSMLGEEPGADGGREGAQKVRGPVFVGTLKGFGGLGFRV